MKKVVMMLVLLLGIMGCGKDKEAVESGEKKQVVVVGTNAEYPPFEYLDHGKIAGIDPEIIEEISKKTGIEFQWQNIAFDALIPSMQMGKLDMIIACMTVTEERAKNVNFSTPYLASPISVIVNKEHQRITDMTDLQDKKYGVQLGTTQEAKAQSITGSTVVSYPQPAAAVLDLLADKLDAVVVDESVGINFIKNNSNLDIVGTFEGDHKAIAVSKEKTELLDTINTALEELLADGTIENILNKHLGEEI